METKNQLQPNTTQVPNIVIDEWMPVLKDTEIRVLLIVIRQTLGWIEADGTGRRKERDWISRSQLVEKTQRSAKHISAAIKTLVEKWHIIEALAEDGTALDTAAKRQKKFGKIYYRLNLKHPEATLFGRPTRRLRVTKGHTATEGYKTSRGTKRPTQKGHTTKETVLQKEIQAKAAKADYKEKEEKSQGEVPRETGRVNRTTQDKKTVLPTTKLIAVFKRYTEEIRHTSPTFERGKDGNLIKAALRHLREDQIELLFLYHLTERSKMGNTIGAALCKESIQGFINATRNEQGFYLRMTDTWKSHNKTKSPDPYGTAAKLALLKQQLATKLAH
jgi:hypothetical protein